MEVVPSTCCALTGEAISRAQASTNGPASFSFAQTLLVLAGLLLRRRNGAICLVHGTAGAGVAVGQNLCQRALDQHGVGQEQQQEEANGRDGTEHKFAKLIQNGLHECLRALSPLRKGVRRAGAGRGNPFVIAERRQERQ